MKELIGRLEDEPIKKVKFTRGTVSLEYDGKKLKNRIVIEEHETFVGRWDIDINAVYVDNDLDELDMQAVAVHETIEKYVSQKYDLDPYKKAHYIATVKEREFLKRHRKDWKSHQIKVGKVWRKEAKRTY